jgi:putative nucleic acid binding protein
VEALPSQEAAVTVTAAKPNSNGRRGEHRTPEGRENMSKVTVIGVWCLLLGACLFSQQTQVVPNAAADQAGEIEVSAAQLLQEYKDNEVAANEKYKGKLLAVKGKVYRVTAKDVELKGEDKKSTIYRVLCKIGPDDTDKVKQYKADQVLTIKGVCDGKSPLGVSLTKCKFE